MVWVGCIACSVVLLVEINVLMSIHRLLSSVFVELIRNSIQQHMLLISLSEDLYGLDMSYINSPFDRMRTKPYTEDEIKVQN